MSGRNSRNIHGGISKHFLMTVIKWYMSLFPKLTKIAPYFPPNLHHSHEDPWGEYPGKSAGSGCCMTQWSECEYSPNFQKMRHTWLYSHYADILHPLSLCSLWCFIHSSCLIDWYNPNCETCELFSYIYIILTNKLQTCRLKKQKNNYCIYCWFKLWQKKVFMFFDSAYRWERLTKHTLHNETVLWKAIYCQFSLLKYNSCFIL